MAPQPVEILFLGIFRIGDFRLHLDGPFPFLALNDLTRDNKRIVTEDHFQEIDILLLIGRTEIFHIIQDDLPLPEIRHLRPGLHDLPIEIRLDGLVDTGDPAGIIQVDDHLLINRFPLFIQ